MAPVQDDGTKAQSIAIYGIDDYPPFLEALPLGLQHLLIMFTGAITPPFLFAGAMGMVTGDTAFLIQMALIVAGIATIVQAYPIGPVGARLPIVMGTSIVFLGPMIGIGKQFGLPAVFGAALVAAVVEIIIGFSMGRLRKFFPPLVTGVIIMLIGLTLIPVGTDFAAGGIRAEDYGEFHNLFLSGLVVVVTLFFNQFFQGFFKLASVFFGMVIGYIVAIPMGMVRFADVVEAGWVTIPVPLNWGITFEPVAIVTMAFIYVVTSIETIGDVDGTTNAVDRKATKHEMRGALVADGVMSAFGAVFNALPNTSYTQNLGLIHFTGVASRYVVAIGGILLFLLGLVPKIGAIVAVMPYPVLGGGVLVLFAMIFSSGIRIISQNVPLSRRNMIIIALSVAMGLGVELRPDVIQHFPENVQLILGSGLVMGGVTAVLLNVIMPGGVVGFGPKNAADGLDPEQLGF